jgi:DNA polymerase-4
MRRYREKSDEIMAIFAGFSPEVQQISIDEAFIDITGMEGLFGSPQAIAVKIKERVFADSGLRVSVGVSSNKYLAKIASGMSKPNGLFLIPRSGEEEFMCSLPVEKIWGAGNKTQEIFKKHGFKTGGDIHRLSLNALTSLFGNAFGLFLYRAVRGEAAAAFDDERGTHSISAERTFPYDLHDEFEIETALFDLCQGLIWRLLDSQWQSRTVSVKIRYGDFTTVGARESSPDYITTLNDLYDRLLNLFRKKYRKGGLRLLGAGLMNLEKKGEMQSDLFDGGREKEQNLEKAILDINKKFPGAALRRGRTCIQDLSNEK